VPQVSTGSDRVADDLFDLGRLWEAPLPTIPDHLTVYPNHERATTAGNQGNLAEVLLESRQQLLGQPGGPQ
jgi:hypothetical protein